MKTNLKFKYVQFQLALLLFAVVSFGSIALAQGVRETTKGIFQFETVEIDYGTIEKDSDGMRTFTFTNQGSVPIVISDIKTSCGCTVPTKPKGPVFPGETANIDVKYKTSRVGAFAKSITVISNATEARKVLKIKGVVVDSNNKLGE